MKRRFPYPWLVGVLGLLAFLPPVSARAWESLTFALPSGAQEKFWRDALAKEWHGQTEQVIEGGRVDVLTTNAAVEVEFPDKWHEGIGQALHYAHATGRPGVLAVISYAQGDASLRNNSRQKLELIEKQCTEAGLRMVVLFPNRAEEFPHVLKQGESGLPRFWLTKDSNVRHNDSCIYYGKSKTGHACGANDGHACHLCGG